MPRFHDIAKFLAGLFTWEAVIHAALLGRDSQAKVLGWKVPRQYSITQTIIASAAAALMIWFGWRRRARSDEERLMEKETVLTAHEVEEQLRAR